VTVSSDQLYQIQALLLPDIERLRILLHFKEGSPDHSLGINNGPSALTFRQDIIMAKIAEQEHKQVTLRLDVCVEGMPQQRQSTMENMVRRWMKVVLMVLADRIYHLMYNLIVFACYSLPTTVYFVLLWIPFILIWPRK
jgi:hypothetical protein